MIDKPTQEIIQFADNDMLQHKWENIFNIESDNMEPRLCANNPTDMEDIFN